LIASNATANNKMEMFVDIDLLIDLDPGIDINDDSDTTSLGIPVIKEKAYMRLTYLQAVLRNVLGKLTWDCAIAQLHTTLHILSMASALPLVPQLVSTLQSAQWQLGIDPDAYIIRYSVCPLCWKHYTPLKMTNLKSADCVYPCCNGNIFTIQKGNWVPNLINPQVSLIGSLRHMFL
jgi:hypothetical protein